MGSRRHASVHLRRTGPYRYVATNEAGASIELGRGEGLFNPVELLMAAAGACSAIDVDAGVSPVSEPTDFRVRVAGEWGPDEAGASALDHLAMDFHLEFCADESGDRAADLVAELVRSSHDRDCTVGRTVEHPTRVDALVDGTVVASSRAGK
ncbi:OsmC-like protein [Propionibacterium ruminifibrarum]|uniref:OsmC-like protein n=1 Tax=Propionibacterium ruminifibrarum TaxID=1962131 RepID=A0A375I4K0_9ACTN|nr:OsmC-like protein [Propionibacterium ruminifibrarum]